MELVLLMADLQYHVLDSTKQRIILGIYNEPMKMQEAIVDFKEKNYDSICTFWSEEFQVNVMDEIDIKDLIP